MIAPTTDAAAVGTAAGAAFDAGHRCAESVLLAVAHAEGRTDELVPRVATTLCSGLARTAGPCGALTGAALGIGLALGRDGPGQPVDAAYQATQQVVRQFEQTFGHRGCRELLDGCDLATPEGQALFRERGLGARCRHFTQQAAEWAAAAIAARRG